jgi:hypothetical protein
MSSKTTIVKLTDKPPEYKIGNRWMNHSTRVTLTPDNTDAKGIWSTDRGIDIDSSSGTPHAKYEWNRGKNTLELVLADFTTGDSSKKLAPETVLLLADFDNLMGTKGGGVLTLGKNSYGVTWEVVVGLPNPDKDKKQAYVNNNPKATDSEIETGTFLDVKAQIGELKGVSRVEGAAEVKGEPSADYRFVKPDGTKLRADLSEPQTTNTKSIVTSIFKKSRQANVSVVKLGRGTSGQLSIEQTNSIARDVTTTPGISIDRVIIIKDGKIIVDETR